MEKTIGLTLIVIGLLLVLTGILLYSMPLKEWKENPLIILPLKRNGILIGFSPLLFLILLILYLVFLKS